jgi:hypothetical protein
VGHHPEGRARGVWRALVGAAHQVHTPQVIFVPEILKNSEKNHIKFSGQSENFDFSATFYCTVKAENRQNMAFYSI